MSELELVGQWLRELVLPGLGALIAAAVFALLRRYIGRIDDERLRQLLLELVRAAEQIYGPGRGAAKLRYVIEKLGQLGLKDVSRDKVEAAVYEVNNHGSAAEADG
jgi:hypothetical protein